MREVNLQLVSFSKNRVRYSAKESANKHIKVVPRKQACFP